MCAMMQAPLWFQSLHGWAHSLKRDVVALWIAARDPRTPRGARWLAGFVAAYALSPIDLIPDFIPVIGYLDDLIIVPLGLYLAVRQIPPVLMLEFRASAAARKARPVSHLALAAFVLVWLVCTALAGWWLADRLGVRPA